MSKSKERSSAAIFGLLDAIKSEGLEPIDTVPERKQEEQSPVHPLKSTNSKNYQILDLDTDLVKPWYMANRINQFISEESCHELIESIKNVGQQIPALVRYNSDNNIYELICGARRLFACKILSIQIRVAVVDLDDRESLLAMDAENRPRKDISPYERALDYKNWIDKGIYKNQAEIYKSIGMKKSLFNQIFALSNLNKHIVQAFGHPANLTIKWGYQLVRLCKDQDKKTNILNTAKKLIKSEVQLKPNIVFKELLNSITNFKDLKETNSFQDKKGNIRVEFNPNNHTVKIKATELQEASHILNQLIDKFKLTETKKV